MRKLREYGWGEWMRLAPLEHGFKQVRNDWAQARFVRTQTPEVVAFIDEVQQLQANALLAVVAFEQPKVLGWLLHEARGNVKNARVLVFDNSRDPVARQRIREVLSMQIMRLSAPRIVTRMRISGRCHSSDCRRRLANGPD